MKLDATNRFDAIDEALRRVNDAGHCALWDSRIVNRGTEAYTVKSCRCTRCEKEFHVTEWTDNGARRFSVEEGAHAVCSCAS